MKKILKRLRSPCKFNSIQFNIKLKLFSMSGADIKVEMNFVLFPVFPSSHINNFPFLIPLQSMCILVIKRFSFNHSHSGDYAHPQLNSWHTHLGYQFHKFGQITALCTNGYFMRSPAHLVVHCLPHIATLRAPTVG